MAAAAGRRGLRQRPPRVRLLRHHRSPGRPGGPPWLLSPLGKPAARRLVLAAKAATYGLVALAAGQITAFGSFLAVGEW